MLKLKPNCEACGKPLPPDSTEAMICSFECTFCRDCVEHKLSNVCPNCGGGFQSRPIRPRAMLERHPADPEPAPVNFDVQDHNRFLERYRDLPPEKR